MDMQDGLQSDIRVYCTFDENGFVDAFYSEDVYGPKYILDWESAVEVECEEEGAIKVDDKCYRVPLIYNRDSGIPKESVEVPMDIWIDVLNGKRYFYKDGKFIEFVEDEKIQIENLKNELLEEIQNLSDIKTKEAQNYIAQMNMSDEQWERYQIKYQKAKSGDYDYFELEASNIDGVDAKDLAEVVIREYEASQEKFSYFVKLVEFYRRKAKSIVLSLNSLKGLELSKQYLLKAKDFDAYVTEEEIKKMFEEFESELKELNEI